MTGVPRSTIGDIVTGRVSPTLATMEQLAAGLKTTISELYDSEYKRPGFRTTHNFFPPETFVKMKGKFY